MAERGSATEKVLFFLRSRGAGSTISTVDIEKATRLKSKTYWTILKRLQDRGWLAPSELVYEKKGARGQRSWKILQLEERGDREKEQRTESTAKPTARRPVAEYFRELKPGDLISTRSIMEQTGVTRTSAHEAVQNLEKKGLIERAGEERPPTGRPLRTYRLLPESEEARAVAARIAGPTLEKPERTARTALEQFLGKEVAPPVPSAPVPATPVAKPAGKAAKKKPAPELRDPVQELLSKVRESVARFLEGHEFDGSENLKQKARVLVEQLARKDEELRYSAERRTELERKVAELTTRNQEFEERLREREGLGKLLDSVAARMEKERERQKTTTH